MEARKTCENTFEEVFFKKVKQQAVGLQLLPFQLFQLFNFFGYVKTTGNFFEATDSLDDWNTLFS